jgi:hypothetical protein
MSTEGGRTSQFSIKKSENTPVRDKSCQSTSDPRTSVGDGVEKAPESPAGPSAIPSNFVSVDSPTEERSLQIDVVHPALAVGFPGLRILQQAWPPKAVLDLRRYHVR